MGFDEVLFEMFDGVSNGDVLFFLSGFSTGGFGVGLVFGLGAQPAHTKRTKLFF